MCTARKPSGCEVTQAAANQRSVRSIVILLLEHTCCLESMTGSECSSRRKITSGTDDRRQEAMREVRREVGCTSWLNVQLEFKRCTKPNKPLVEDSPRCYCQVFLQIRVVVLPIEQRLDRQPERKV
jgi:hypothetical protein